VPSKFVEHLASTTNNFKIDAGRFLGGLTLKGKGVLKGTTFSGHPTATSLGNTMRNWIYHLYALWINRTSANSFVTGLT